MSTKKIVLGGLAGGITFFVLGYIVFGMLLANFMQSNAGSATGVQRSMDQMIWWSLVLGNLCFGFLLSYVINRGGVSSVGGAAGTGFVTGLLSAASFDFIMYATSNVANLNAIIADIVSISVMAAISGAVIALVAAPKRRMAAA